jgi:hypothetical protein
MSENKNLTNNSDKKIIKINPELFKSGHSKTKKKREKI